MTRVLRQEARLYDYKRDAMLAFIRANKINRIITSGGPNAKIGIITTGKSYLDVRQALDELGIDEVACNALGLRLFKVGCPWPHRRHELQDFAKGLDLIIVVEEKRSLIEVQVREELYGNANQPVCIGKKDERDEWLFPAKGALDPNEVAIAIGERLLARAHNDAIATKVVAPQAGAACAARDPGGGAAHALFLFGLPAQFIHRGAGRHARLCRHRLPLHGAMDGPLDTRATRRWAARAPTGSARRRSPRASTCSRISATALTITPAISRSAQRSRPASTSPTRSCSTTRSR